MHLSSSDIARLARAAGVLLSPLDHPQLDGWRAAVNDELRELLGADSAGFLLPVQGVAPMFSNEHSPEVLAPFPGLVPPPLADGTPIWRRMLEVGTAALDDMYGRDLPAYLASAYYNDFAARGGGAETLACTFAIGGGSDTPLGAASLHLWHGRRAARRFGRREVAMLSLLAPAFRAGVESRLRFDAHREHLLRSIDLLEQAVMVCDAAGLIVHATSALDGILADDADAESVRGAMLQLAADAGSSASPANVSRLYRALRTRVSRYSMYAYRYVEPGATTPLILVPEA